MPRRPVPVEIAKRRGNPGRRRLPEPIRFAPLDRVPDPPADLGPVEREAWMTVAGPLTDAGALQTIHLPVLRQLAIAVGIAERARMQLAEEDLAVKGHRGAVVNPLFRVWAQSTALAARLAAEFGGSPSSLTSIGLSHLRGKSLQQELAERYGRGAG